ncbi:MAG TPA: hypothetical protein VKW08_05345 [Xanthobacteraceae bacterium]|nr:hypothetical protein [Xanthobacteraceae bacterium]
MARAEEGSCAKRMRGAMRAAWRAVPRGVAGLISYAALSLAATLLTAQTADQAEQAARDAIRKLDLQTELPHLQLQQPSSWHFNLSQAILWVVAAIAAGVLLYALRDLIPAWRADAGAALAEDGEAGEATSRSPAVVLEAADELAARGHFVDAMHVLLLHGLAHIRERLDLEFSDSLTSREILKSRDLPDAARISLRDVVRRVELTYFGLQPAGSADYAACRASFNALERALQARAAA